MIINADLHIHSCFSRATSKNMVIDAIAPQAKLKGLQLVGTGDGLHPGWLQIIKDSTEPSEEGIYSQGDCDFIITAEVEDNRRVHHLMILPSIETAHSIREKMVSVDKEREGRPRVRMDGAEIMDIVHDHDGLIGPAHAFTPWTSMYKAHDSYMDCYGKKPDFLELGLSADTEMADLVKELQDIPFLTNSDAHSPWPHRLGREFNSIEMEDISFNSLKKALHNRTIKANYGFDPNMGKYHMTACTRCYEIYDPQEALNTKMKCSCGGTIKKGVDFRISEIADWKSPHHPSHRPPYIHILPLAEMISLKYSKGVTTKFVQGIWELLVNEYDSEIDVILNAPLVEIKDIDSGMVSVIQAFREKTLIIVPGGGGKYGEIRFPENNLDNYF
ncbi:TIGR00375 family protein [Methanobacterium alcaliphilum]|uniref:TIGR00375 family protein n=1 Tax=Methanobacterium alcaliphilum TaxID=392018 RepID=UPI00200B2A64|nr:TIGR00375 family protein [Methanobacterium alcaliphilum]MCK9151002.1 TIGR00375 family protein [Methanobacterium alcaliphilum]